MRELETPWPHSFVAGNIEKGRRRLCAEAIEAWAKLQRGHEPCLRFWEVMDRIAERLDIPCSLDGFLRWRESACPPAGLPSASQAGPWKLLPEASDAVCLVQCGHWGDILNILPIAKRLNDCGNTPWLSVPAGFESVFNYISYARPFLPNVDRSNQVEASTAAKHRFRQVIQFQIDDINDLAQRRTPSWNMENWSRAGVLDHFHDPDWPLILDRCPRTLTCRAKIAANLTSARTCPFPYGGVALRALNAAFPGEVCDIGGVRLPHFFDLLGILETARVIVSIDTGTAHLAAATSVPVVQLVGGEAVWRNGTTWRDSILRYHCAARFTYDDATEDVTRVVQSVQDVLRIPPAPGWLAQLRPGLTSSPWAPPTQTDSPQGGRKNACPTVGLM